jgi:hypothetical protein
MRKPLGFRPSGGRRGSRLSLTASRVVRLVQPMDVGVLSCARGALELAIHLAEREKRCGRSKIARDRVL